MDSICNCPDSSMISKQRQEIVLLTDELTNQCTEIDRLIARNSQLQSKIKVDRKEKCELENRIKSLLKEVALLQDEQAKIRDDLESTKKKLIKKDQLIQSQAVKYQQLSLDCEKHKQQISELQKQNNEIKVENSKLKQTVKDQSSKIVEAKGKEDELVKIVENKNELIKLSTNQIKNLEQNLTSLANVVKSSSVNNSQCKSAAGIKKEESQKDQTQDANNNSSISDEVLMSSILKSLKDTWLESNLKYEELKNLIMKTNAKQNDQQTLYRSSTPTLKNSNY